MFGNKSSKENIWSVSGLTDYLKKLLEDDPQLSPVILKGEISNFHHHSSGHMYFTLKDKKTQLKAVMFRGYNQRLDFTPEEGMSVIAQGKVSIYPARGEYQIYIHSMEPDGIGSLHLAYEQLKERLEKEGLFKEEFKKPIPKIPAKVGVVTSATGAALRDIISVAKRRFSNLSLLIAPSQVQGKGAGDNLVKGIEILNESDVDVIIIGRGGGSIEDLWAFNKEKVARAIFESKIPVISAVGHETDLTIVDFVADLRAPTPSAAAELVASNREEVKRYLDRLENNLYTSIDNRITRYKDLLARLQDNRAFVLLRDKIRDYIQEVDELSISLERNFKLGLERRKERLEGIVGKLNSLSPLNTLARGYALARDGSGKSIASINGIKEKEEVNLLLKDGEIICRVEKIIES
ncbi:exodeoxyribonuclease VII large subunit [Halonatronum saccharophilum]|uniref:exodeoxyribonuclease VII large subunit n=1 Tax=Halonatronum saccharophilum TaxID=150060 RepID=UPI00048216E5|nr:exodeoxyribonuclease VII large subunit [Halonatronum saccharophilum]